MISTSRVLIAIVQLCFQAKEYNLLNEQITVFAKRRGQLKQAVVKMVQEVCGYIDQLQTKDLKYQLIETLRGVTEGKVLEKKIAAFEHYVLYSVFSSFF